MRRFMLVSTAIAVALLPGPLPVQPAKAQVAVVCPMCADKATQLWSYAQQLEQLSNAVTTRINTAMMLKNQVTNMVHLPEQVWHNITGNFAATQGVFRQGTHLMANAGMVSGQLRSMTGYIGSLGGQYETFQNWSVQANDNITATLAGMGLMRNQMDSDRAVVDRIRAQSGGAEGAMQALQANTEMGSAMVNELHRARELTITEIQMNANALYLAQQEKDRGRAGDVSFMAYDRLPENGNRRY